MKKDIFILIVEDNSAIYLRMKDELKKEGFLIDAFTRSVEEAIGRINIKRPDVVLLDIDLYGYGSGIDLGNLLYNEYQIPFIYVTDHGDNKTYFEALKSQHQDFIEKEYFDFTPLLYETKPELDSKKIVRAIYNLISRLPQPNIQKIVKDHIIGYVDYVEKVKGLGFQEIQQKTVELKNVAFFTRNSTTEDKTKPNFKLKKNFVKLKDNYTRFVDWNNESLYIPQNLKKVVLYLPYYFVQISDDMVVNIHPDELRGTINGMGFHLRNGQKYQISRTFKEEVKKRIEHFYITTEKIKKK